LTSSEHLSHNCKRDDANAAEETTSPATKEDADVEGTDTGLLSPLLPVTINANGQSRRDNSATHTRDVLCSTFSTGGLRKLCYPHYGLDPSTRSTLFRRELNDVYLLISGDRKFALKVYQSEWRTPAAILSELEAVRHLAAKGIDVALPIARQDGRWLTNMAAPEGRRSAVLFQWVDGAAAKWSEPSHSAQLGRLLARMHAAADDISSNGTRPQMTIPHLMEDSLARIREALEGAPQLAQRCDAIVNRSRARLRGASNQPGDWGFCHGDLFLNNARIEAGRLVLLDFDWCGFGWRVFDLATFRWTARLYNAEHVAWRPFIDAYLQVRPSATSCLEFLRLFMILRHLWHITQCIRTAALTGEGFLSEGYFEDLISQCERIEADPDLN
jgi:Ser/Thr protein kinase RdoA (MazF antagonist)